MNSQGPASREQASFGALLKRYRLAAGLSQEALAERARLSAHAISAYERGRRQVPYRDTLRLLVDALNLPALEAAALMATVPRRRGPAGLPTGDMPLLAAAARAALSHAPAAGLPVPPSAWELAGIQAEPGAHAGAPPFVGRTRELALLESHLAGEGPPVLLLAGEPGIGKSRLLREAAIRAARTGRQVLAGGCTRRGGQESYAPLLEAIELHLRSQSPVRLGAALRGCAWLVRLLPELADGPIEPLPSWTVAPAQERRLLFGAVTRYLANVAGPSGTLLLLDDLQWAGIDALDLLATLARAAGRPLRVLGAYRDSEVTPQAPLAVMLADLAQASLAAQRTLGPLSAQEAGQLLDALLVGLEQGTDGLRERMVERTGGLPFFVVSCARGLRLSTAEGDDRDSVPWDVTQSIRQRAAALPDAAREVLDVAAVIGRVVRGALLVEAAARPWEVVLPALEAIGRARLLEEERDDSYRFAHDVVREVIDADLSAARRTMLHRRVAEALERTSGEPPIELLAYHYAHGMEHEKAVRYGEQAGDRAATRYANAAAEGYYHEALERLERRGQMLDGARVREKLGAVLAGTSRYTAALAVLDQAAAAYRAVNDFDGLIRVTAQIGRAHSDRGTPEQGILRIEPLLEGTAASDPSSSLAALHAALAYLCLVSGRYHEAIAAAGRAADLARTLGDGRIQAEAQMRGGIALLIIGRRAEAVALLEETIRLAEAVGALASLSLALSTMGMYRYLAGGEFATARLYIERGLAVARQLGDPAQITFLTCNRAWIAFHAGDWQQARLDFEDALAMSQEIGVFWRRVFPLTYLGHLLHAQGEWRGAAQVVEEAVTLAAQCGDLLVLRLGHTLLAVRDVLEGNPEAARARLAPLLDRPGGEEWHVTRLLPTLAWAYLELGDVIQAADLVAQAVRRARTITDQLTMADALRVQALIAIRQGRWPEAERALAEGVSLTRRIAYPYAEGQMLVVHGSLHAEKGEPDPARERLEAALAIFRRLGARADAEWAERALARLQPL